MAEAKIKKAWYKKWWAITLFVIIGLMILSNLFGEKEINSKSNTNIQSDIKTSPDLKAQEIQECPQLTDINFTIHSYSDFYNSWIVFFKPYKTNNYQINFNSLPVVGGSNEVFCDKGSHSGENMNYIYCRSLALTYNDDTGNIIWEKSIDITINSLTNQTISIECK